LPLCPCSKSVCLGFARLPFAEKLWLYQSFPCIPASTASDLPRLDTPEPIENKIFKIEQQILDRLDSRDKAGKQFDYRIEWLHNSSDFSHKIQDLRLSMPSEKYLEWLEDIDQKTA
jgi:hypothetical protein